MDKYINYKQVIRHLDDTLWDNPYVSSTALQIVKDELYNFPAADVAPVIHGKWIRKRTVEHEGEWYCSICGKDMLYTWGPGCGLADYCPHCGARMDGDGE